MKGRLSNDKVKTTILQAYKLVPEAYRQWFRNLKKTRAQTHVEKEILFDRWCSAYISLYQFFPGACAVGGVQELCVRAYCGLFEQAKRNHVTGSRYSGGWVHADPQACFCSAFFVMSHPIPLCWSSLWQFLGMADWYRCFFKSFLIVVAPLTELCDLHHQDLQQQHWNVIQTW